MVKVYYQFRFRMLKQMILVGLGGGIGSILRFLTSVITARYYSGNFPVATFTVNIIGCLLIGFLTGLISNHFAGNENMRLLFIAGFCGGYTTFSTFALENMNLLTYGHTFTMCIYIILSVLTGIFAVRLGLSLGAGL